MKKQSKEASRSPCFFEFLDFLNIPGGFKMVCFQGMQSGKAAKRYETFMSNDGVTAVHYQLAAGGRAIAGLY